MDKYSKYTWVCTGDCDALIEYTYKDGYGWPNGVMKLTCPCGSNCTLLSSEDATINPNQPKQKEDIMIDTPLAPNELYNPSMLVTYKKLNGYSDPEYITEKVTSIEWELHNSRQQAKVALQLQNKIDTVKSIILEAYTDSDDQETLLNIAEALDIELTKEISWEATINVSGTIQVSLTDDFDFESELNDNLFVDAQNGDIQVDNYEVANVQEAY
jgi:hypothetical protein